MWTADSCRTCRSHGTLDHAALVSDILAPLMTLGIETRCHHEVLDLLALKGNERILDVGCGTGTLARDIARRLTAPGAEVVGLDAATKMLAVASA